MRILILGGTTEAASLAERLAGRAEVHAMLSLAGRTREPKPMPLPVRIGGFGGTQGLRDYLALHRIDRVIDATHPFAAVMSAHAAAACAALDIPLMALRRSPWQRQEGDDWRDVASMEDACLALGEEPLRVFLTIGRLEVGAFLASPRHHYLVRSIEPIGDALAVPHLTLLQARGPFSEADELTVMREHCIDIVVSKNSGGDATYGKIAAARRLGLPVVLVRQPSTPDVPAAQRVAEVLAWLGVHEAAP